MIARMNMPPLPPSVTVQNKALPKLVAFLGNTTNTISIWSNAVPTTVDAGADSAAPVELGVRFQSDIDGKVTGIRFYKSAANTGTHVANLWSLTGTNLASKTFTNETASGWQQVTFNTPISIKSNTVYIASYYCTLGHYSDDFNYFASNGVDTPPLHAPMDGVSGGNGCFAYGATSLFPTSTYSSANYWVDIVFSYSTAAATNPPVITAGLTNMFVLQGTNVNLLVTATGSPSYQWRFNNGIIAGATNTSYTITNVQPSRAGTYSVLVANTFGKVSSSAYVSVGTTNILTNCIPSGGKTSVTLGWCPSIVTSPTNSPVAGYRIYYNTGSVTNWSPNIYDTNKPPCPGVIIKNGTNWLRSYVNPVTGITNVINVGTNLTGTVSNLLPGFTYYFAATAYDTNVPSLESDYSSEVSCDLSGGLILHPPTNFTVSIHYIGNNQIQLQTKVCSSSRLTVWYKKTLITGAWVALATNQVPDVYGNYYYTDKSTNLTRFYKMQLQ